MNKEELVKKAGAIPPPTRDTALEYTARSEQLAAEINRLFSSRPDLESLIGPGNLNMMQENHRNHTRFMSALLMDFQPEALVETVLWVFRAYRSHGFQLTYWPAQLDAWVQILKKNLHPESFTAVYPIYHFMIINQPVFARLSNQFPENRENPST